MTKPKKVDELMIVRIIGDFVFQKSQERADGLRDLLDEYYRLRFENEEFIRKQNTRHQPAIDPKRDELQSELSSLRAVVGKMTEALQQTQDCHLCSRQFYSCACGILRRKALSLAASHGVDKKEEGEL